MFKFMLCFTRSFCFHLFKCYIFFTNHQGFSWIYLYILVYGGSLPSRTSIYVKKKKKKPKKYLACCNSRAHDLYIEGKT